MVRLPVLIQPVELEMEGARLEGLAMVVDTDHCVIRVERTIEGHGELRLRLRRAEGDAAVDVRGLVRRVEAVDGGGHDVEVGFGELSLRARAQLADLALWDARSEDGVGLVVHLRGRFDERTDFSPLNLDGYPEVTFDVAGIERINSWGARAWIMFLRSLRHDLDYTFRNASLEFVKHCNMVADMTGRGVLTSFYAPYVCEACKYEDEHLLAIRDLKANIVRQPPAFTCGRCGGASVLDDIPRRYFAFLSSAGRALR